MAMNTSTGEDPFQDPLLADVTPQPPHHAQHAESAEHAQPPVQPSLPSGNTEERADVPATLTVGRNASLTLGTDSLIVQGGIHIQAPRLMR